MGVVAPATKGRQLLAVRTRYAEAFTWERGQGGTGARWWEGGLDSALSAQLLHGAASSTLWAAHSKVEYYALLPGA